MTRHTFSRILLGLFALLLVTGPAFAFFPYNPFRTWNSPPTYIVDSRGLGSIADGDGGVSRTVGAVTSSAAWNGAGSGTLVNAVSGSVLSFQLGDGVPMLNFQDPFAACTGTCLASTYITFHTSAAIFDADIVTNSGGHSWTSQGEDPGGAGCVLFGDFREFYIEGVMVHEIGHALGLAHTNVAGATMLPTVGACDSGPASTAADDENGINALYGTGYLALFQGNDGTLNRVCDLYAESQQINFKNFSACANDETRSLRLKHVKSGFRLRVFDDPGCKTSDDWTEILVKQNISQFLVGSYEQSSNSSAVQVIHHHNNGLDGKVSCISSAICGDGTCERFESCGNCSADCGVCPFCGDGSCNGSESCSSCSSDCGACGCNFNGFCEPGSETPESCSDCCEQEIFCTF